MSRSVKIILVCSLLLNMLLGGMFAGHMLHRWQEETWDWHNTKLHASLPPEKQQILEEAMESAFSKNRDMFREIKQAREETLQILSAPTFDAKAYDASLNKISTLYQQRKERMSKAIKKLAKSFTPQERAALAELLDRRPHGGGRKCPPTEAPVETPAEEPKIN